jgi:hypothetical protein
MKVVYPKKRYQGRVCITSSVFVSSTLVFVVVPKRIPVDSTSTSNVIRFSGQEKIELLMAVLEDDCEDGL